MKSGVNLVRGAAAACANPVSQAVDCLPARLDLHSEVRIWSAEHGAYWRHDGHGYTERREDAGVFTLRDAVRISGHCGRQKGIQYELIPARASLTANGKPASERRPRFTQEPL